MLFAELSMNKYCEKRHLTRSRTCAILGLGCVPNKPDVAKVVPTRIGTLLATFCIGMAVLQKFADYYESALLAKLRTFTGLPCLKSSASIYIFYVQNRYW